MPFRPAAPPRSPFGLSAALALGIAWAGPLAAQPAAAAAAVSATASPETLEIQRLVKDGQHAQALKLIDDALAKNPRDAQMRFRRGVALSMLDRKSEALAVFQKLVEDHPELPGPYNNLAVLYGAQGDYEKARQTLEKAIHTNPAYATAYQNLGDVYAQLASQAYSKALQVDGKTEASVQPKLALLRELIAGPNTAPPSAAAKPGAKHAVAPVATTAATTAATASATTVAAAKLPPAAAVAAPPAPATVAASAIAKAAPPPATAPASTGAPARSASAPVAPPAVAAAPAAATAPTATTAGDAAAVEAAVRAWASAWARRDMAAYFAAYAPEFSGQASSRKAWERDRRDRIAPRKQIKVDLQDLRVSVDGDRATAKFKQVYASDALSATSRKTLQLVRSPSGRWVIKQEALGN